MEIQKIYILIILLSSLLFSCRDGGNKDTDLELAISEEYESVDQIPLTTADIGEFPFYISSPVNYHFGESVGEMNFNEVYRFYTDSSTLTIGGKYYEAPIVKDEIKQRRPKIDIYEDSLILAHFDSQIKDLGGVETDLPSKFSDLRYAHNLVDSVKRYIIRTNRGNIWIDLISLQEPRQINYSVIFEGIKSEPVNIIKADRLRYALENYGKVVVYVNFSEGKISLQPDGIKAVEEFVKLMRLDPDLRISIEGHTDDAGTAEYCRRLSYERVVTIADFMKNRGVKESRFKKVGYGSTKMVADNNSNESRAKNRRIELIKTNVDETGLRNAIDLNGKAILDITFETGKYILKPEGLDIVDQIAKLLTTDKKLKISIEGHTDDVGSSQMNKKLSQDRANAVVLRLVELGIDRRRLRSAGYGSERPVVPNNSPQNREKNRRVEIVKVNY